MSEYDDKLISTDSEFVYFGNILNKNGRYDLAHLWGSEGIVAVSADGQSPIQFAPNMSIQTNRAISSFQNVKTATTAEPLTFSITFACIKWGDRILHHNAFSIDGKDKYADSLSREGKEELLDITSVREQYYPCEWTEDKLKEVFELFNVTDYTPIVFGKHWYDKELDEETEFDGDGVGGANSQFDNLYYLDNNDRSFLRHIYRGLPQNIETTENGKTIQKKKTGIYSYYKNESKDLSDDKEKGALTRGGYTPIYYNVMPYIGSVSELILSANNYGYVTIPFVCDAPHAWQLEYREYRVNDNFEGEHNNKMQLFNLCNFKDKFQTYRSYPYMILSKIGKINGTLESEDKIGFKLSQLDDNGAVYINNLIGIGVKQGDNDTIIENSLIIDNNNSSIYKQTVEETKTTSKITGTESYLNHLVNKDGNTYINFLYLEPSEQNTTADKTLEDLLFLKQAIAEQTKNSFISEETKEEIDNINEYNEKGMNPFYHRLTNNDGTSIVYSINNDGKIILAVNILSSIIEDVEKNITYRKNFWNTINLDNNGNKGKLAFTVEFYVPCACMNQLQE